MLYLARRLVGAGLTVIVVSFVAYAALTFAPGDAAEVLLGENASAEQLAALRAEMRLDDPLVDRYASYIGGVLARGDLGLSLASGRPVSELLMERVPATLTLAGLAIGMAALLGAALGLLASTHPGSRLDVLIVGGATLGVALPPYWVALLMVLVFSLYLGWLPVYGAGTAAHLVLPTTTLALPGVAMVARMVRSSVLETSEADFVRTALAKGLTPRQVLIGHVLPNSVVPTLNLLGLNLSHLIGGAFVVETIFAWPGLGRLTVQAILDRDIPVVLGAVLVVAPLCMAINLAVDLLHGVLDPRVRQDAL